MNSFKIMLRTYNTDLDRRNGRSVVLHWCTEYTRYDALCTLTGLIDLTNPFFAGAWIESENGNEID